MRINEEELYIDPACEGVCNDVWVLENIDFVENTRPRICTTSTAFVRLCVKLVAWQTFCEGKHRAKGLCSKHYQEARNA